MKKILVFDAYPSIRQLLAEEIKAEGHVTMSVGKAESLTESIARFEPDLIVLDLYTRGGILWDLLWDLKRRHPAIPILLFTAFHPNEFPRFNQADGWVQKSFLFEELKEKIRVLLAQRKNPSAFGQPILAKDSNQKGFPGSSASAALTWEQWCRNSRRKRGSVAASPFLAEGIGRSSERRMPMALSGKYGKLNEGKIAHAFLFSGERGVGKTSLARILAKALNCHSKPKPTEIPCNICPSCIEITAGNSMDVLEIDGASNTGVDDVRILRENVRYKPARDRYKVYIIDEVHMLSKAAFNALLKTLEEPPPYTIFMFATTEPEKLPDTIISRCLRFDLKRIATQEIIAQLERLLKDERIHISKRGLFLIARAAEGSMRDAQSLLDRILAYCPDEVKDADIEELLGRVDRSFLFKITEALTAADPEGSLTALNTIYESGFDLRQFYYAYLELLRDLMVAKVSSGSPAWMDTPEEELKEVVRLAQTVSAENLQRVFRLR